MPTLELPIRFYQSTPNSVITLHTERTAFLLVDCDGEHGVARTTVIRDAIAPALAAARKTGMRVLFLHEAAYGLGGSADVTRDFAARIGRAPDASMFWKPKQPRYETAIQPTIEEPELPKSRRNGFDGTHTDYYLKSWNVDTIVAVGFALRSCLYHTCMGARDANYRVILLRDCTCPPDVTEFPDTRDPHNPEGGWMRFAFVRMYETNIGSTSTAAEFIAACQRTSSTSNPYDQQ